MTQETLTLKWGTIKGWRNLTEESVALVKQYFGSDFVPLGCMTDHPDDERKAVLCRLIDQLDGEIWNDWDGKKMDKETAKKYILEFGK